MSFLKEQLLPEAKVNGSNLPQRYPNTVLKRTVCFHLRNTSATTDFTTKQFLAINTLFLTGFIFSGALIMLRSQVQVPP